jgi:hypothetical protein
VVHSKVNNSNLLLSLSLPHSNNPRLSLVTINPLLHLRLAMMVLVLVLLYRRNYPRLHPDLFSHRPLLLHLVLALALALLDHLNNPRWRPAVVRTRIYPLPLLHLVEVLVMTTTAAMTTTTMTTAGDVMSVLT